MPAMRHLGLLADVAKGGTDIDPLPGERLQEVVRRAAAGGGTGKMFFRAAALSATGARDTRP